ncbi:hypothetical protein GCM10016234_33230 [Tianweitania populi]|uniref:Acyclic terpene utilisation N-terminal domain-containing protein n=2 Tax=Tianweitania populi TaxID=1607949 RepID=A0A8J3GLT2_9HYPH|nr:hypothetical protein GCM10016234_33230 [Tianweitania populi]
MIYETLAERTLAQAQLRLMNGGPGYLPRTEAFLKPVLEICLSHGIRIIGNFGAADPAAACSRIAQLCNELGLRKPKLAYVAGDNVMDGPARNALDKARMDQRELVAANAYIGAASICEALDDGAEIVVTGRVSDPSLALGPLMHVFKWGWEDWDRLAAGTLCGHVLECAAQVTGGYFADPGIKDVPDLANIGFPVAEISRDGVITISKPSGTGGCVTVSTVREQVLYEIDDPASYITPDVVLDLTNVRIAEAGPDRVTLSGAKGREKPRSLRAMACYKGGWFGEAEISYTGPNAVKRGRLAADILDSRLRKLDIPQNRVDLIGVDAISGSCNADPVSLAQVPEIRVRLAVETSTRERAQIALDEVESLYLCGPAGGGGVRNHLVERLSSEPVLIPRELVTSHAVKFDEASHG